MPPPLDPRSRQISDKKCHGHSSRETASKRFDAIRWSPGPQVSLVHESKPRPSKNSKILKASCNLEENTSSTVDYQRNTIISDRRSVTRQLRSDHTGVFNVSQLTTLFCRGFSYIILKLVTPLNCNLHRYRLKRFYLLPLTPRV